MEENRIEYELFVKSIIDEFSDMCSVKRDYEDFCNYLQNKNMSVYYNFRQADVKSLIDILHSGDFENDDVHKIILKRQELAKENLSKNMLTYTEWEAKNTKL